MTQSKSTHHITGLRNKNCPIVVNFFHKFKPFLFLQVVNNVSSMSSVLLSKLQTCCQIGVKVIAK